MLIIFLCLSFKSFGQGEDLASKAELLTLQTNFENQKTSSNAEAILKYIDKKVNEIKSKPILVKESIIASRSKCYNCPPEILLTESINDILQKMKENPSFVKTEDVPVNINKLNLLFYIEKSRLQDGSIICNRFLDYTKDLKPTSFPGAADLVLEDVFQFDSVSHLQLLDPSKEEILYYYRGEGAERNIVVEARLTRQGGKFRYFYYRPTIGEENPYNLPNLGEGPTDVTVVKKSLVNGIAFKNMPEDTKADSKPEQAVAEKKTSSFEYTVDPKVEMRNEYIPKEVYLASSHLSQEIYGTELSVKGSSILSLSGNRAIFNLKNEKGYNYAILDLHTSLNGRSTSTLIVPYEIKIGDEANPDGVKLSGHLEDNPAQTFTTFSLTDRTTHYFRTEIRKNQEAGTSTLTVAKDFNIGKAEVIAIAVGKNEANASFTSLQHRKAIKDNVTMVLDVRYDTDKKATLIYQLRAQF